MAIDHNTQSMMDIVNDVLTEVERQDHTHGPFEGTYLGKTRLAIACVQDEAQEAFDAWRMERKREGWDTTRIELMQTAAVAMRALRDAFPPA